MRIDCNPTKLTMESLMLRKIQAACLVLFCLGVMVSGCRRSERPAQQPPVQQPPVQQPPVSVVPNDPTVTISAEDPEQFDYQYKEEIRRKFAAAPDMTVEIAGINGRVTVETVEGDEVQLLVVRSAKSEEDLPRDQIRIEQPGNRLEIGLSKERRSVFGHLMQIQSGRQRVIMRLPSRLNLEVFGVSGRLMIGEIGGRLEIAGVNGKIEVQRANGAVEIAGNNGAVDLTIGSKSDLPVEIRAIDGKVTLRFEGEVNASFEARGINGKIDSNLPGYTVVDGNRNDGRLTARIGRGGRRIEVTNVDGSIGLLKADDDNPDNPGRDDGKGSGKGN